MKKILYPIALLSLVFVLNSCGVNNAYLLNQNIISTQVELSEANFEIIERVTGEAKVSYVLIFGGQNRSQLFAEAYAKMVESADLEEGSRTLVNVVTEEHVGGIPPFYYTRTVTVSAHVVAFDE